MPPNEERIEALVALNPRKREHHALRNDLRANEVCVEMLEWIVENWPRRGTISIVWNNDASDIKVVVHLTRKSDKQTNKERLETSNFVKKFKGVFPGHRQLVSFG